MASFLTRVNLSKLRLNMFAKNSTSEQIAMEEWESAMQDVVEAANE